MGSSAARYLGSIGTNATTLLAQELREGGIDADLTTKLDQLDFKATAAPTHLTDVSVGVFFEQVRAVDDKLHEFTSIFYTIYRWKDERDYSILFDDANFVEARPRSVTNLLT